MATAPQPDHDRTYTSYGREYSEFASRHMISYAPVDDEEEMRMDEQNRIINTLLGGPIVVPFPPPDEPEPDVLDCGYGHGAWIDGILEEHGDWWLTGIDVYISGRRRLSDEDNDDDDDDDDDDAERDFSEYARVRYNLNASWASSGIPDVAEKSFDLINSRCLIDGINADRWPGYIRDLKSLLRRGGWLQLIEIHHQFQSAAGRSGDYPMLVQWWEKYKEALGRMGKDYQKARQLRSLLVRAGYEAVGERVEQLPIGGWKQGSHTLGTTHLANVVRMLRSWSIMPFKYILRMSDSEYNALIGGAIRELAKPDLRLYFNVYVAYGRKPRARR